MSEYKKLAEDLLSETNRERIKHDQDLYVIYNGQLREKIYNTIREEFSDAKTVMELQNRIVPINITKKIIDALGQVYLNEPIRTPAEDDENDQELINLYSRAWQVDTQMDFANKLFKLTKHSVVEPYLDLEGTPRLRALPSHTFSLYSDDPVNPEKMTSIVKHIRYDATERGRSIFEYWDNEKHFIINGEGAILWDRMLAMGNEEGINPYGRIPFVHINSQRELLIPIPSTDIKSVQIAVCLLLSDAALAQKYLSWGTLVITGGDGEERVKVGPGAVINLPSQPGGETPTASYLQPELNTDEVLNLIDKLVETLLTTNNLSAGTVIGKLSANNSASGVAKMLDRLESTEDKEQQQKYFKDAEKDLWELFAHSMLPVWVDNGKIDSEFVGAFSQEFELDIEFPEIKMVRSERETIENIRMKLDAGLISVRDAIRYLYPEFDDNQVEEHLAAIQKERVEEMRMLERNMSDQESQG